MNKTKRHEKWLVVASLVLASGSVMASDNSGEAAGCARQFEVAQRMDMESFRDYDAETFRVVHADDAITIFPSGSRVIGIDQIMAAFRRHFERREAIWEWTELHRSVQGCKTAYIVYDTTYKITRIGFVQHALVGVTYTHEGDKWLAVADQNTALSP